MPILTEGTKASSVCGETCPHSFQLRAFISPLSTGTQSPFETYCPQLRPLWKATDVAKIIPACRLSCFSFKGRQKEREEKKKERPSPALNHWTIWHLRESVCTCSADLAGRAEPFTFSLKPGLMGCSVVLTPFTWSSCLWLPEQIEVMQATSRA